jgi:DNA-binding phage protein
VITVPSVSHKDGLFKDLQDPEFAAEYFNAALEDGDLGALLLAMKNLIDARGGMTKVAKRHRY